MSMFKRKENVGARKLLEGVTLATLAHGEKTLMGRFTIDAGSDIPAHDHPHEQIGLLISGRMELTIDGVVHDVSPGDSWCIEGGVAHSARALEDSVAVEVFTPVREDYLNQKS